MIIEVLLGVFILITLFLAKELVKKFRLMRKYIDNSKHTVLAWRHNGAKKADTGMKKIVLRSQTGQPFSALVAFEFPFGLGVDHYGHIQSDERGVAVLSTFLGKGACDFYFILDTSLDQNPIDASCTEGDQRLAPSSLYKPHWFQS